MEPGPSGSRVTPGGVLSSSPVAGPSHRPYLAQPVQVPNRFLVAPEHLLPHQVRSGIDIGNLFKLLNALQNRIAFACGQHQYLRDPLNQPRPPEDGGYKPLTPQAAVRDLRSLCKQQRNLMEKLRRWNCTNEGKCYDIIINGTYTGICANCEPFAASRLRMKQVDKAIRKQTVKAKRKALKKLTASPLKSHKQSSITAKKKVILSPVTPPPPPPPQPCQVSSPARKRRKKLLTFEPPHPESFLSQENFLGELGLVTPEVYKKTQAESRRTERRRRTTANPKYKTVGVDPNEAGRCKRSRRSDPSSLEVQPSTLSSPSGAERRRAKQKRYECAVCEKKDVTVQCNTCMSGFHPECIRVTASKASAPTSVPVCPNCVHCNPSIRSSDCILLSRRMLRPSIMSLKSDQEPLKSPRTTKTTARRKLSAKKYARRSAASSPSKSPSFRSTIIKKKAAQRKSFCKRTLNHSLAVAAAAAVPAYCTTTNQSQEESGLQRKRKLEVKTTKQIGSERRVQTVKREYSQTLQPESITYTVEVDVSNTDTVKDIEETQLELDDAILSPKLPPEEALQHPKPKKAKQDKLEENIVPGDPGQGQSKVVSQNKPKKNKPGPIDPFCMKRTMMAMSAAAGIVLSNSGIKLTNSSNPPPSTSLVGSQKGGDAQSQPLCQGGPQKVTKSNPSPLGNLNTKSFEKEVKKPQIIQAVDPGKFSSKSVKIEPKQVDSKPQPISKPAQKIVKQTLPKPPVTPTTVSKVKQKPSAVSPVASSKTETSPETNKKPQVKPVQTSPTVNNTDNKLPLHPKPAIISNLLALKKKSLSLDSKPNESDPSSQTKFVRKPTPKKESPQVSPEPKTKKVAKTPPKMDPALEQSVVETIERVVLESSMYSNPCKRNIEDFINTARQFTNLPKSSPKTVATSTSDTWAPDDFTISSNHDDPPSSPASNSSTIGSPRSLRDLDSDSDDLLSIPDTPMAPYLELKRLEQPGPFLDLNGIDRYTDYRKETLSPAKRGRGRGRGGRH